MEFIQSEKLRLDSGGVVWMKALAVGPTDLNDILQHGVDLYAPRLIVETTGGVRHEAQLVRQTRAVLTRQLEGWLSEVEALDVIERFGIGFHTELDGHVIPDFYELRD